MGSLYNIMAPTSVLDEVFSAFPDIEVTERFDACDINVDVPIEDEDRFTDWCEEHDITCEFIA